MSTFGELIEPVEIRLKERDAQLEIDWNDGHASVYPLTYLRQLCQCAECIDEWTRERRLDPAGIPADLRAEAIRPVGRYALNFRWSDGHETGIYSFDLLRRICPCPACGGPITGNRR